ncbi:MAG: RNA polymerase sigma factor [Bdellovibrionota bacterium]
MRSISLAIQAPFNRSKRLNSNAAFKKGDNDVFSSLYNRFKKPIFKYVSGRIFDAQVAEEVTQEIFIKAFRFRDRYDEKHAFSTWLWTIARNTVFDVLRKGRNEETRQEGVSEEPSLVEDLPCPVGNAELLLERRDLRRMLKSMLKPLTALQRRVLWMLVVQQRSYAEISKQLGISISGVKNLAYRARISILENFPHSAAFSFT